MRGKTHNRRRRSKKQHKRSRKVQRAGAYMYSGTYGCAFGKPPLKCLDEAARRGDDIVSKAVQHETALEEFNDSTKFFQIDRPQKYFITPQKVCKLDSGNIRPEDEITKCPKIESADLREKFTHLLLSTNGGENLSFINPKYEDYVAFFESLVNLFDGMELAHTNGVAHCDIKPPNIVSLKKPDGRFHTRYIDFGFSKKLDASLTRLHMGIFDTNYLYWPLETGFYYYTPHASMDRYERKMSGFYSNLRFYAAKCIPQKSYFEVDGSDKFEVTGLQGIVDGLDKSDRSQALKWLDIYSLGITIAQVYYRFIPQTVKYTADGTNYAEIPVKIPLATDPQFREIMDWHTEVQNRITIPLSNLIYKMIHVVPQRRPAPLVAKAEYEAILPAMRDLFTKEMLFKSLKPTGILGFTPNPPTPTPQLSPTNLSKIQVSPVPNRVRPHRDPREAAANNNYSYAFENSP